MIDIMITAWCLIKESFPTIGMRLISHTLLKTKKTQMPPWRSCFKTIPKKPPVVVLDIASGDSREINAVMKEIAINSVARFRRIHTFLIAEKSRL